MRKVQSENDKREYHLEVTEKYISYYNMSYRYIGTVMKRLEERFAPEELEVIDRVLEVMYEELMPEIELRDADQA